MTARPRLFFGWYIIGLMIVTMMLVFGIRASFSVFFEPVLDHFGWFRGSTAIMLSLNIFIYGLAAPVAGILVDRWRPRTVAVLGLLLLASSTSACYFATRLWHFYLLFGVLAPIGSAFCSSPILNATVINWFDKRRGLAVGLGQIGGGLSFAYSLMVEAVISLWDWRASFLVMGSLIIVVLLPLFLLIFYHRPEDKGLKPYGAGGLPAGGEVKETAGPARDWTLGVAFRTYQLWLLVFAEFCIWGIGNYVVLAHQVKFAEDIGFSPLQATSIFALFGLVSIAGQVCSSISDSIGREKTVTVSAVLAIGGLVALTSVRDTSQIWLLYVYAVSSGFATGLFSPAIIVGLADIFRGRNIATISALLMTGIGFGGVIGPWLGGHIYDIYGSYDIAFIISMAAFAVGCISYWLAAPRKAESLRARLMQPVPKY
jgi:MFS family permease